VNKKQLILCEAKRLFGHYGYLGFTLKQLAQACAMTSPALYYFYTGKADLFRDCLLSEMLLRQEVLERCIASSSTLADFAQALSLEAIAVCGQAEFTTGQAMREIVHLPAEMQRELRAAWITHLIDPVETFLRRILSPPPPAISFRLLAVMLINMATFAAANAEDFSRAELTALFIAVVQGMQSTTSIGSPSL
jgi:AcrR family transcriptional regulator